jgi:DNA-binding NarL/FixJ family response regulator
MTADAGTIRVLLVDDERLVRTGLRAIIDAEPDLEVVGESDDGDRVVPLLLRTRPHVVLMDLRMPNVDGLAATRDIVSAALTPAVRVLVLTTFEHDDHVYAALRAGASGFLLKRATPEEMLHAIRVVAGGESLLFPATIRALAARHDNAAAARISALLTDREQQVLRLMAAGLSNAEIGRQLRLGVETVKSHVRNTLRKLRVRDRTQAVVLAYETRFVTPN